ncbi:MAG: isochorismatase family cysteine hydrolase [Rubrobacteraceae bacterium]
MPYGVDEVRAAVVAIDLHRGHLDPEVATMPVVTGTEDRIIESNRWFFERCRSKEIRIIHQLTSYRDAEEIRTNPFWRTRADDPVATRKNVEKHNIQGTPGCEIIPSLLDSERDWVVDTKKRYNCFVGTDLDFVLRKHGINTVLITGVNTNSCVLSTATSACSRDYAVLVVEDCVDSMDGPEVHEAALTCIRAAFGWVITSDEVIGALNEVAV